QMTYYSLTENTQHLYTKPHTGPQLHAGDEIIVQVAKDAVKTKDPVVSSHLNFTGKYCVLTLGKTTIGFSNKIVDQAWKDSVKAPLMQEKEESFGIIVRTNARDASMEEMIEELRQLRTRYHLVMESGQYRTCYSLLYEEQPSYVTSLRDTYAAQMDEIITDDPAIYQTMENYLQKEQPEDVKKLIFYKDPMVSLIKLYRIEKTMEEVLHPKVWLKSGGYLVIESTEACHVIDVNTGKYTGKKNLRDTLLKINLEAAREISKQLRLRNLSGIILIDFIDMEMEEDKKLLMSRLADWCAADSVKTNVVDMTKLNLVEVTRKKLRRPLYEEVARH
ncbi:MAG: ribonuclease E/G, partial [Hungatella sp.]